MPDANNALHANRPDLLDEVFDGEAVIVNVRSGYYYSLNPAATAIWGLFTAPRTRASVSSHFSDPKVDEFLDRLIDEKMVLNSDEPGTPLADVPTTLDGAPELQRFDDMKDLLMFDPIHDIDLDGDGWPVLRPQDAPAKVNPA